MTKVRISARFGHTNDLPKLVKVLRIDGVGRDKAALERLQSNLAGVRWHLRPY